MGNMMRADLAAVESEEIAATKGLRQGCSHLTLLYMLCVAEFEEMLIQSKVSFSLNHLKMVQ